MKLIEKHNYYYSKKARHIYLLIAVVLFGCLANNAYLCFCSLALPSQQYIKILSYTMFLLFAIVLYIYCLILNTTNDKKDIYFGLSIACLGLAMFAVTSLTYYMGNGAYYNYIYLYEAIYSFTSLLSYYLYWLFHIEYLGHSKKTKLLTTIFTSAIIIYAFVYSLNYKYQTIFYLNENYQIEYVLDFDYIIFTILVLLYFYSVLTSHAISKIKLTLLSFSFSLVLYTVVTLFLIPYDSSYYYDGAPQIVELLSFYIVFLNIYKNDKDQMKVKQNELQTAIMVSQIQPHFIFNSLTAIRALYRTDIKKGEETLVEFSNYLRSNMDSISKNEPILFSKELEHTMSYLNIEKTRFGDDLNVEYVIRCTDFLIPALSLQPIVENAVNHGICKNENGGTIKIVTYKKDKYVYVEVIDNGPGFVYEDIMNDGKKHIAIVNVKKRIEDMLGGELIVDSKINVGTKVTFKLKDE